MRRTDGAVDLLESRKGSRHLDRPPRRRGGSGAPLTRAQLRLCLAPVIERDILLVTDGHPAYRAFAREAGITHRAVNLSAGVRVAGAIHVQNVNAYHSRFKQWLRRFHGVASHYLPNYLGWRWAIDGGRIGSPEILLRAALRGGSHTLW
jgi:hypothetical protein